MDATTAATTAATIAASAAAVASAVATVALVLYASAQTKIQERAEQTRREERRKDEDYAVDLALAAVNAEYLRLVTLATLWKDANLVSWVVDGRLDASDVLPADWATLTTNLARLGAGSAALANMALVKVRDISLLLRKMKSEIGAGRNHEAEGRYSQLVREATMEAALLLEDAIAHCPRSRAQWPFDTDIPMKSKTGQSVVATGQRARAES